MHGCKSNSVRKTVNDGLSRTLVRALPHGTVWMDEPSLFVVSGVANTIHFLVLQVDFFSNLLTTNAWFSSQGS